MKSATPLPYSPLQTYAEPRSRKAAKPIITQSDLVARLQLLGVMIDQSTLSKIENGQRPVTDVEVAVLAKALKVSVSWLFEGTEDR